MPVIGKLERPQPWATFASMCLMSSQPSRSLTTSGTPTPSPTHFNVPLCATLYSPWQQQHSCASFLQEMKRGCRNGKRPKEHDERIVTPRNNILPPSGKNGCHPLLIGQNHSLLTPLDSPPSVPSQVFKDVCTSTALLSTCIIMQASRDPMTVLQQSLAEASPDVPYARKAAIFWPCGVSCSCDRLP